MVHSPDREEAKDFKWFGGEGGGDCRRTTIRYEDWRMVNEGMPALDVRDPHNFKESTVPAVLSTDNGGWADGEVDEQGNRIIHDDKMLWVGDPATKIVSCNGMGFVAPIRINGYMVEDEHFFDCHNFVNWHTFLEQMKEFNIPISSVV